MAIITDTTALIALGEIGRIGLLQSLGEEILVPHGVRHGEARRFSAQLQQGEAEGWLTVRRPNASDVALVRGMIESFQVGQGEAECIAVALALRPNPVTLLIDEGETFQLIVENMRAAIHAKVNWNVICLAEVLQSLAHAGVIASAEAIMRDLTDNDYYAWAPAVKKVYRQRCAQAGIVPLV